MPSACQSLNKSFMYLSLRAAPSMKVDSYPIAACSCAIVATSPNMPSGLICM